MKTPLLTNIDLLRVANKQYQFRTAPSGSTSKINDDTLGILLVEEYSLLVLINQWLLRTHERVTHAYQSRGYQMHYAVI